LNLFRIAGYKVQPHQQKQEDSAVPPREVHCRTLDGRHAMQIHPEMEAAMQSDGIDGPRQNNSASGEAGPR